MFEIPSLAWSKGKEAKTCLCVCLIDTNMTNHQRIQISRKKGKKEKKNRVLILQFNKFEVL